MRSKVLMIAFAMLLILNSCEADSSLSVSTNSQMESDLLMTDEVVAANKAMTYFFPKAKSFTRSVDSYNVIYRISELGDTTSVVVDYDNSGYVILSKNRKDILAISENGSYKKNAQDPSFNAMIDYVSAGYSIRDDDTIKLSKFKTETDTTETNVFPMTKTCWHQREPFNKYATNSKLKLAGCTPVAIAQVMAYYGCPSSMDVNFAGAPVSSVTFNWPQLVGHSQINSHTDCDYCEQLALLLRQIGKLCDASYNAQSTGAWPYVKFLKKMGLTGQEWQSYNLTNVLRSLSGNKPCVISAFTNTVGHSWVIDGYKRITITATTYESDPPYIIWRKTDNESQTIQTYLSFNYGNGNGSEYVIAFHQIKGNQRPDGPYEYTLVSMFDSIYTDVQLLITDVQPL